jgi:hypothetical protein
MSNRRKRIEKGNLSKRGLPRPYLKDKNYRRKIEGDLEIDYSVFKKSPHEKELLKEAKLNYKSRNIFQYLE